MRLFCLVLGLVFVFEGILPFLVPHLWRRMMEAMIMQENKMLRIFGLGSMLVGLAILYLT